MQQLNVRDMIKPIIKNYDLHVNNFIRFLRFRLNIHLMYEGPFDIYQHILQKTTYACSVYLKPKKILKNVFPIMIGSRLDFAIRHNGLADFFEPFNLSLLEEKTFPFQEVDIATGFFIISGFLRQLPYFYTNDPTNTHVIQRKKVRVYSYDARDRGKELNYYVADVDKRKCGQVVVVCNDGSEIDDDPHFFDHCPYPIDLTAYMQQLYVEELFDIDHLGNKMVVSPGHMFVKLFVKYLYDPLRKENWKLIKSQTRMVCNSIEDGFLLSVLSRKTVYFKEGKSAGKMTNEPRESHREISVSGEVFMEKNIGCYREVSTQTYPLNPYLLYVIVRQLSNKCNNYSVESFHDSFLHFLCILGVFETKNVGRTSLMVRDTIVSTCDDLDPVYNNVPNTTFWNFLNLEPCKHNLPQQQHYVVVNEACIPVSKKCFLNIELLSLKRKFKTIECFERGKFIVIRYKVGMIMKKLPTTPPVWVTPYDKEYWMRRLSCDEQLLCTTSHIVDLNRFFNHTSFPKVILALNALKNAVLATDSKYAHYFMDTLAAYYRAPTPHHVVLIPPADDFSKNFVMMIPQPVVTYMSFKGCTQEDCIVKRKGFRSFDFCRFYTLRLKITASSNTWVKFYPVYGDQDPESDLLGTLISGKSLQVEPFSMHVNKTQISDLEYRIHFTKPPFRVLQHFITGNVLIVAVEQEHVSSTGDKLCSIHGQKGVIRVMDKLVTLDNVEPDLIINVYGMFRQTPGQILESIRLGGGKDAQRVFNSSGIEYKKAKAFYGKTFYFVIVYLASEHLYAPSKCVWDKVTHQPVKGRSRGGGMKLGNMEGNALRGNGIALCFEQKFFEHGDRVYKERGVDSEGYAIPKSVNLVIEDAKHYKCDINYEITPSINMEDE